MDFTSQRWLLLGSLMALSVAMEAPKEERKEEREEERENGWTEKGVLMERSLSSSSKTAVSCITEGVSSASATATRVPAQEASSSSSSSSPSFSSFSSAMGLSAIRPLYLTPANLGIEQSMDLLWEELDTATSSIRRLTRTLSGDRTRAAPQPRNEEELPILKIHSRCRKRSHSSMRCPVISSSKESEESVHIARTEETKAEDGDDACEKGKQDHHCQPLSTKKAKKGKRSSRPKQSSEYYEVNMGCSWWLPKAQAKVLFARISRAIKECFQGSKVHCKKY